MKNDFNLESRLNENSLLSKIKSFLFSGKRVKTQSKFKNIQNISSDRGLFDKTVYTPLAAAFEELKKRREDEGLEKKILKMLGGGIPEPLQKEPRAVIFRHVATPNYENRRFISLVEGFEELKPLFWEYYSDKFTSNNECKRTLGKLFFFKGKGKNGGLKIDSTNIIDFNNYNGHPISSIKTLWGQNFIDFHHEFFRSCFRDMTDTFFDSSEWFKLNGKTAQGYYKSFLTLFIRNGILFENFLLDEREKSFTENVFMSAFIDIHNELGLKPLIVALEPTNIEGNQFWLCYPGENEKYVEAKLNSAS